MTMMGFFLRKKKISEESSIISVWIASECASGILRKGYFEYHRWWKSCSRKCVCNLIMRTLSPVIFRELSKTFRIVTFQKSVRLFPTSPEIIFMYLLFSFLCSISFVRLRLNLLNFARFLVFSDEELYHDLETENIFISSLFISWDKLTKYVG